MKDETSHAADQEVLAIRDDYDTLSQRGYPGGCVLEVEREHGLAGVQGGAIHFGIMLEAHTDYDTALALAPEFGGRVVSQSSMVGWLPMLTSPIRMAMWWRFSMGYETCQR